MRFKSTFKKVLTGVKSGYKSSSKFVKTYGPPTHNYLKNVASGVEETFEIRKPKNSVNFKVKPMGRFRGINKSRVRVRRFDFDNLGMRY
jgi:Holliday junction resolvase RusA-like endonuclease